MVSSRAREKYLLFLQNMTVKWTKIALASLRELAQYIKRGNFERARTFIQEIRMKTDMLQEFPSAGRAGRVLGTRELIVHENYIVPYRMVNGNVEILRVHHVAKNWPKGF